MNYKAFVQDVERWAVRKALPYMAAGTLLFGTHTALPSGYQVKPKAKAQAVQKTPEYRGKIAFVSERDGQPEIYIMDADGKNQRNLTRNPADDNNPVWSPDGKYIAFISNRNHERGIYAMDIAGGGTKALTRGLEYTSFSWSLDGKRVVFICERDDKKEIYSVNANGSNLINLSVPPAKEMWYSYSPRGNKLAVQSSFHRVHLYIVGIDGTNLRDISRVETNSESEDRWSSWSPDGKYLAFESDRDNVHGDIYVMNSDGTNLRNLTKSPKIENLGEVQPNGIPEWSPDGKWIAFVSHRTGDKNSLYLGLHIMDPNGKHLKSLPGEGAEEGTIFSFWSPDSRKIAYRSMNSQDEYSMESLGIIYLRNNTERTFYSVEGKDVDINEEEWSLDSRELVFTWARGKKTGIGIADTETGRTRILKHQTSEPSFSPDGRKIVFVSKSDENEEIYTMDSRGGHQRRLTKNKAKDYSPRWQPMPKGVIK